MRDLFEFLELRLVEVPDHPYREAIRIQSRPDERDSVKVTHVTAIDHWTPKVLDALTRVHRVGLPRTTAGLMKWLRAGNWETCSHQMLIDVLDVITARDLSGMGEHTTTKDAIYIDKLIEHRLAILRREGS